MERAVSEREPRSDLVKEVMLRQLESLKWSTVGGIEVKRIEVNTQALSSLFFKAHLTKKN
ncbi:hypothetical protein E2C01_092003 [Portunus trituberculatus]|uniref:Uncharacterized protein n=1 Tax=Portunus trituberculatus TaxID=210409 RepID=A0A5B7JUC4_PORTR|nr:hypothetical protein [Portunus trituberculatus]